MKTSDLEVGTDYAYERWKRAGYEHVTVLALNVTGVDDSGFGGRGQRRSGLVKIVYVTGDYKGGEILVRPQTLKMTWTQHHGQQVKIGRYKAEAARAEQAERERRAALAFQMHQKMLAAGAVLNAEGTGYSHGTENYEALLAAGFAPVPEVSYHIGREEVFSAVNDLSDFMDDGKVHIDDVAVLLGEQPTIHGRGFLSNWDWDFLREEEGDEKVDAVFAAHAAASKVGACDG